MRTPNPLKRSLDRILIVRLAIAVVIACAVFGTVAMFVERARLESELENSARVEIERFRYRILGLLDAPALDRDRLQSALEEFSAEGGEVERSDGHFVVATLHGPDGDEVARVADRSLPDIATVESVLTTVPDDLMDDPAEQTTSARLDGGLYIGTRVPLHDSRGAVVARVEGVYAVSAAGMATIRQGVRRAVGLVVVVVLVTGLVIYPVIGSLIGRLARTAAGLLDSNLDTLQVLGSAIAKRDSDTDAHNYRVTVYAVRLAEAMNVPRDEIRTLIKGSLLHDVGKIGIRDAVLLKPGRLTDEEFDVMKTHVEHGLDITERSTWLEDARDVVAAHHERFDGAGYPRGLRGDEIPISARIFAIADVFDALTSKRPYKEPFSFEETIVILDQGRGTHFDPDVLDTFRSIARDLHDEFAGLENERPRHELHAITERYFPKDAREILA
jgi:HD-GYP domain-containing protein (c-di-GMP phosphodiesterase class II)